MTDPKTWWFLENVQGRWLENTDHGTFTSDPNAALKWPNEVAADDHRRHLRHPLWMLTATEHKWIEPTPSYDGAKMGARQLNALPTRRRRPPHDCPG